MVTPEVISTVPNQTVTLHCTSNTPEAVCSFYREGDVNGTRLTGEGGVDLQILSPQSYDAGVYVCRCTNSEGSSEDNGTIVCKCVCLSICLSVCLSLSICAMCRHMYHTVVLVYILPTFHPQWIVW